jgi:hypothetical protein
MVIKEKRKKAKHQKKITDTSLIDVTLVAKKLTEGKTIGRIAFEMHTFRSCIREICHNNSFSPVRDVAKINTSYNTIQYIRPAERKKNIKPQTVYYKRVVAENFLKEKNVIETAETLGVTREYIRVLEKSLNLSRRLATAARCKKLIKLIKNDIEKGLSYEEIVSYWKLNKKKITYLQRKFGFPGLIFLFVKRRNDFIQLEYKNGKTITEILQENNRLLYIKEKKIKASAAQSIANKGFKRYPGIGLRTQKGVVFESMDVLKKIEELRDVQKMSFSKIAEKLNAEGIKTISGATFYYQMVAIKYNQLKTLKKDSEII